MSQYKPMLAYIDEEGYSASLRQVQGKISIFKKALGVASHHIAVEDTVQFADSFTKYFKREFFKKHKDKIQLDISVEKLLNLMDVNLSPLYDLEVKFQEINAELKWEYNKPVPYVDKKPFERWTTSAEENEKVKAGRKLLDAIEEISKYSKVYPMTVQNAVSGLVSFNIRTNSYYITLR